MNQSIGYGLVVGSRTGDRRRQSSRFRHGALTNLLESNGCSVSLRQRSEPPNTAAALGDHATPAALRTTRHASTDITAAAIETRQQSSAAAYRCSPPLRGSDGQV